MFRLIVIVMATAACPAFAQSVTLPPKAQVAVGEMGTLNVVWAGSQIRYDGGHGLNVSREYTDDPKECVLRFFSIKPGEYVIRVVACQADKMTLFQRCVVTVGDLPPVPPTPPIPPGPNPPPAPPPVPPPPVPPPTPTDPAFGRLQAALKTDPDAATDKASGCATLSAFFTAMASHVKDPNIKTVGDLLADYRAAVPAVLKAGAIPAVRKQIAAEIVGAAGDDPLKTIDPALRDLLVKLFELLASILKSLNP